MAEKEPRPTENSFDGIKSTEYERLKNLASKYIDELEGSEYSEDRLEDLQAHIFAQAMELVYGEYVFDYVNQQMN